MVRAVNQGDRYLRPSKRFGCGQAAESSSDNNDAWECLRHGVLPSQIGSPTGSFRGGLDRWNDSLFLQTFNGSRLITDLSENLVRVLAKSWSRARFYFRSLFDRERTAHRVGGHGASVVDRYDDFVR